MESQIQTRRGHPLKMNQILLAQLLGSSQSHYKWNQVKIYFRFLYKSEETHTHHNYRHHFKIILYASYIITKLS